MGCGARAGNAGGGSTSADRFSGISSNDSDTAGRCRSRRERGGFIGRERPASGREPHLRGAPKRVGAVKNSHRKVVVFSTLVTVLTLTSALLLALAPAPLAPEASSSLFAIEAPQTMDAVFQTETPIRTARWKYIYIHHSRTASGNAMTLGRGADGVGDHFVIGNGDGSVDGEIQVTQRWNRQHSAAPPPGATAIDRDCISICLVGDYDRAVPSQTQLRRLAQLVGALQGRLHIGGRSVQVEDKAVGSAAGVGKYFPLTAFREQLLP